MHSAKQQQLQNYQWFKGINTFNGYTQFPAPLCNEWTDRTRNKRQYNWNSPLGSFCEVINIFPN